MRARTAHVSFAPASFHSLIDNSKEIAPDPAALRARLKHRAPPPATTLAGSAASSASSSSYDAVLDIARRLAELERERAQDTAYIRSLELANATLQREKRSAGEAAAARARAEAEAACAAEVERVQVRVEAEREEGVRGERARAERAEGRVRALEGLLEEARERCCALEGVLEGERRRREEWECGLEALVLDGSRA